MARPCTIEESCNMKAAEITEKWNKVQETQKALYEEHDGIVDRINSNKMLIEKLRKEEVCNVLNYVRSRSRKLSASRIDTLLCHCQNMLNGNIDNIVLTFSEGDLEK